MTSVRIAIGSFSYATGVNIGDGTSGGTGHVADVDGLSSADNDLVLTLPTDDFSLNSGDTVGFTFTDADGATVIVTDGVVQQSGFTDGGTSNMSGILTIEGTDQNGDPIALLLRMDGVGINAGQSFYDYDPAASGADVILDEPITTFYLGNYADVDPIEASNNYDAENAGNTVANGGLVGATASGTDNLSLVAMQPQDNHNTGQTGIGDNDLRGSGVPNDGGDRITYISPTTGEEVIGTIDSSLTYMADVLLSDGSTLTTEVVVIQMTNGDVFVSDLNDGGTLDNLVVESISLTSLTGSNYTGFRDNQSVDGTNVSNAVVDGEETGEVMGPGYDDSGQATNGGGDIIDGADGDNDSIRGNGGDDTIDAGAGDDTVDGGADNDSIDGGLGSDSIDGGTGADSLDGGAGNDFVCGGDGNDTISGGESSGTPLPDEPTSPTEHQFTIIDPAAFTTLNGSLLFFPSWQGEFQGTTDTVQTITINDLDTGTASLAAVENNSAIGPDTDLTLERVTTDPRQSLGDGDGSGGSSNGQFLVTSFTSPSYGFIPAGSKVNTTTEHRFEEYDENGVYIDDFYVFEVDFLGGVSESFLVTSKPFVDGHTYLSTSRAGTGTVAYDELATFSADPLILGDDTLCGGDGDDTFLVVEGNDTITDFNLGNTGSINDGDQTNNDFVDLSSYYSLDNYNAAVAAGDIDCHCTLINQNPA